jgi:formate--tetrahydrofolate ligase
LKFAYNLNDGIEKKIEDIVKNVYGGKGVQFSEDALEKIKFLKANNLDKLPVIIAKTQFSLSDNKDAIGAPKDFEININSIEIRSGAGFIVAIAGNMMLMPGLSKVPNAEKIDILSDGTIVGLS